MVHLQLALVSLAGLAASQGSNNFTSAALNSTAIVNATAIASPTITEAPSSTNWASACDCSTTTSNCYYQYKICNDVMTFVSK